MAEWIDVLSKSLADEYGTDKPRVCTMATVDKNGHPRARSVVCRRISPDGSIWIVSDGRSEKSEQLKATPQCELVFWLPTSREQFRVQGSVKVLDERSKEAVRVELWKELTDQSRALFFWPSPGAKRLDAPETFKESVESATPPPAHFEVLVVRPRRVEQLQLAGHPHRRRRWMLAGNWSAAAEVNP